jgi:shikimate kinase
MGTGKSSLGRVLSRRLGKNFIETDAIIEKEAGKPVFKIFEEDGEIRFRELEIEVIKQLADQKNQVISCGGGVVLNQINILRLKQNAVVIWLIASPEEIVRRTRLDAMRRPLLKGVKNEEDIRKLIEFRLPFYERSADLVIDTSGKNLNAIADEIQDRLKHYADFN